MPSKTEINRQVFSFAQVARLTVTDTGDDFESAIRNEVISVRQQDVLVIQVWLKLSSPRVTKEKRGAGTNGQSQTDTL